MEKPKPLDLTHYKSDGTLGADEKNHEKFGEYLLRKNIITADILEYALRRQQETGVILGEVFHQERFVPMDILQEYSLNRLFNPYRSEHLANLLLRIGKITTKKLQELELRQEKSGRSLGSILIDEGIISPLDFSQEKIIEYLKKK